MLAQDRFYKTRLYKGFILRGEVFKTPYTRYTYESGTKLYDVDVRESDGDKTYHVNGGPDAKPNQYHKAILKHFGV